MTTEYDDYSDRRRGGGMFWFWAPILMILFVGGALSVAAYTQEPSLSVVEAIAAGFAGTAALIVGLFAAAFGVIVGLLGALVGVVAAGGAVAMTLFIIASPVLALVLLFLLLRRPKGGECPDPGIH